MSEMAPDSEVFASNSVYVRVVPVQQTLATAAASAPTTKAKKDARAKKLFDGLYILVRWYMLTPHDDGELAVVGRHPLLDVVGKWYAVFIGKAPGVYSSWNEASAQVALYNNSSHRGFKTRQTAVQTYSDWARKPGDNSVDSCKVGGVKVEGGTTDRQLGLKLKNFIIFAQFIAIAVPWRWHLSYLQNVGTRPSSRLAAVSSLDSFMQQGGDPIFFTSRATRVIDADYRGLVGAVLFKDSGTDFAVKPDDRVGQMIIKVIASPGVAEVEDLDTKVREVCRRLNSKPW
ncbi:Translational activator GCN1 [Hordeum vulgare]|nr:Translational activator GCN1 [Hordeum vulgare]